MNEAEALDKYLESLCKTIRRVCQAQDDGHDVKQPAVNVAQDVAHVMQLGGPTERLQKRMDMLYSAVCDWCPRPGEENPHEHG